MKEYVKNGSLFLAQKMSYKDYTRIFFARYKLKSSEDREGFLVLPTDGKLQYWRTEEDFLKEYKEV